MKWWLLLGILFLQGGCWKVDTCPDLCFSEVQEEIQERVGVEVYWDRNTEGMEFYSCIQALLEKELNPQAAVYIALLNNRSLQAFYEDLGIAKAQLVQAGLLKNPLYALSYRFSTNAAFSDLIDMSLMQNFLDILFIPLKKRVAQAELEATQANIKAQILNVIGETKIASYHLQTTQKIQELKKEVLLSMELSHEMAQRLLKAGNIQELEVEKIRADYELMKVEVASLEIEVLQAREKLNILMGLWGEEINWSFTQTMPEIPALEDKYEDIENCAIAKSIDLQVSYQGMLSSAARLGINTSSLIFPQFEMGPSAEREDSIWYVGPAFTIPIPLFDFGKAADALARSEIMRLWNQYTAQAVEIRSSAREARFELLNAQRKNRYFDKVLVPLAENIFNHTMLQYNAMQLGVFTLLMAKQVEIERKIERVETVREYFVSKTVLEILLQGHSMRLK